MKKYLILPTLAAIALISFYSCQKEKPEESVSQQSIEQTLKVNESVTFTLPDNKSDDAYQIITPATHAYVSKLSEDLQGNVLYCYTPEKDYVGTDYIIVATKEEAHGTGHPHPQPGMHAQGGHHCNKGSHSEQQIEVTISLSIVKDITPAPNSSKATGSKE